MNLNVETDDLSGVPDNVSSLLKPVVTVLERSPWEPCDGHSSVQALFKIQWAGGKHVMLCGHCTRVHGFRDESVRTWLDTSKESTPV